MGASWVLGAHQTASQQVSSLHSCNHLILGSSLLLFKWSTHLNTKAEVCGAASLLQTVKAVRAPQGCGGAHQVEARVGFIQREQT